MNLFIKLFTILCFVVFYTECSKAERSFVIDYGGNQFLKDGEPFRYISGGLHYFRIPKIYWADRLEKAAAMGLNTIQTYIAWNVHETERGKFNFENERNIFDFIKEAQRYNLLVILRPGPYIDAEWEFGGFPWWMAKNASMELRTSTDRMYMEYVNDWYAALLPRLQSYLYKNGGPVIAFQIENEYGSFGCDITYLNELKDIFQNYLGEDVILFTTDGYRDHELQCGTIPDVLTTIDFGTEISAEDAFKQLQKYKKNGPLVNSEYYTGWLDYWGRKHQRKSSEKVATFFDGILAINASVNLYMFHGGTNFGFMNGADLDDGYMICPTSYDYDAPLSEAGDPTPKYIAMREIIQKHIKSALPPIPTPTPKIAYGHVYMSKSIDISETLNLIETFQTPVHSKHPLSFEELNNGYGFVVYQATIPSHEAKNIYVSLSKLHDRSNVYVDGIFQGAINRGSGSLTISSGSKIQILVENQGRGDHVNQGTPYLPDRKGILGDVNINGQTVHGWTMLPINDSVINHLTDHLQFSKQLKSKSDKKGFIYFTTFNIQNISDTYIKMSGWEKGQIYINYNNIGKYWQTLGPQKTLYVPQSVLRQNENVILIVELGTCLYQPVEKCFVEFVAKPILG